MVLPTKEAVEYAVNLAEQAEEARNNDEIPVDFPVELKDVVEDWYFETEGDGMQIWLHSSNGGIDAVNAFIQHLLERFTPDKYVMLEWSNDCSKPRTDAYGGGAAFITPHEVKFMNTAQWIADQEAQFAKTKSP